MLNKDKVVDCQCKDYCNCRSNKVTYCEKCRWYKMIDSGYGFCKATPKIVTVPWCKDICFYFGSRGK